MKKRSLTVLALASALTIFALIPSAFAVKSASDSHADTAVQETQRQHGRHSGGKMGEKTAEPENAIGKDAAKAAALADAGLTEEQAGKVRTHVSQMDDDTVVYKVRFTYDGQRYTYHINAVTGVVVDKENEAVTEDTESRERGKRGGGKMGEKTAEPENAIGKDAAKAAALADAGLTEEQAGKVRTHVSQLDDGTVVYKVHFSCDGQRYTYRINAATGAVVDKENEAVAEDTESREHGKRGSGKMDEKTAEPENAIGKEAAKEAALADAGLTEEQAGKVKAHVSQLDDGTVVYKVHFTYDGQRYAYHINAVTGVVVDKENEAVAEDTESREHGKRGMGQNGVNATFTVV